MSYKYTHFIPENTAPKGAKRISVYRGDERICTVPLGRLAPVEKEPLYSFGIVSDVHLTYNHNSVVATNWKAEKKLPEALEYFTKNGCAFVAHCGDLVDMGFYHKNDSTQETWLMNDFAIYNEIRKRYDIPIYGICGNHEGYGKVITDPTPITIGDETKTMLEFLYDYTTEDGTSGKAKLSYTISHTNNGAIPEGDLFVFVGQPTPYIPVGGEDGEEGTAWLENVLEVNKDKRCFVFVHAYLEEDSGDAGDVRENSIFDASWGGAKTKAFKKLMGRYPNVILVHGHSHMKFENQKYYDSTKPLDALQESYKAANYTEKNGFKSIHVPSLSKPRDIENGQSVNDDEASEAYIVDVYDDCIVLRGMDMINKQQLPLGSYKINTTG